MHCGLVSCESLNTKCTLLLGIGIYEGVRVEGVDVEGGRVTGVRTNKGNISCEVFVNCAGQVRNHIYSLSIIKMTVIFCVY